MLSKYWCHDQGYDFNESVSREEILLWYVRRDIDIHNKTRHITFVRQLTGFALSRLGVNFHRGIKEDDAI